MKPIGGEEPRRPFYEGSEEENKTGGDNKDHLDNLPGSGELMTTGEEPEAEEE